LGERLDSFIDCRPDGRDLHSVRDKAMTFLLLFNYSSQFIIGITLVMPLILAMIPPGYVHDGDSLMTV
jgi:hypothetical protein